MAASKFLVASAKGGIARSRDVTTLTIRPAVECRLLADARQESGTSLVENDSAQPWLKHVATIQAGTDAAEVDAAVRCLGLLIEETAERVCRRRMVRKQIRVDFVANSLAEIVAPRASHDEAAPRPRIAEYNPATGPLPAWLWTVLDNLLKDVLRAAVRRATREQPIVCRDGEPDIAERVVDSTPHRAADELDRMAPFADQDLEQIAAWPVLDRILVLVVFGLWRKIPTNAWRGWCSDAGLPNPFPPETQGERKRGEWISFVAESLSASPNALQNRLRRRLEKLKYEPLEYIRGISHGE